MSLECNETNMNTYLNEICMYNVNSHILQCVWKIKNFPWENSFYCVCPCEVEQLHDIFFKTKFQDRLQRFDLKVPPKRY